MEDIINQPKHYTHGGIEVRPFINAQGYNFDQAYYTLITLIVSE